VRDLKTTTMTTSNFPPSRCRRCPKCGEFALKTIESKPTPEGKRRRYGCKHCDYRETTYEIPSLFYDELVELRRTMREVKNLISPSAPSELQQSTRHVICYSCDHFGVKGCGFGYPEAGSLKAEGCFNYETKQ